MAVFNQSNQSVYGTQQNAETIINDQAGSPALLELAERIAEAIKKIEFTTGNPELRAPVTSALTRAHDAATGNDLPTTRSWLEVAANAAGSATDIYNLVEFLVNLANS
ncbi:hypothetical protein [Plantactinospora sp. B24E8]|uniref:hypothetical protein n=1 Tax=Plantactinospora sp. B24E8 TaxID=3153567 RepID=UPI00325CB668